MLIPQASITIPVALKRISAITVPIARQISNIIIFIFILNYTKQLCKGRGLYLINLIQIGNKQINLNLNYYRNMKAYQGQMRKKKPLLPKINLSLNCQANYQKTQMMHLYHVNKASDLVYLFKYYNSRILIK
ncbi:hypothetical protein FGO68_gene6857 [Halteria grandinella]|uniref:Uncharacterized protein n=1 Tax=Halteria grandinella TaxID=5974 RepID=A0A8J8NBK4_HALGN|nr:hypothetical protein FGO68_gene6857 [Halteria grandinella]